MKGLAKNQQVYRPIYSDILAGFSVIKAQFLEEEKSRVYYIKHLKETDYGFLESQVFEYEKLAKEKGILPEVDHIKSMYEIGAWTHEEESRLHFLKKEAERLQVHISSAVVKVQREPHEKELEKVVKEMQKLQPQRDELITVTVESFVEKKKSEEILRQSFFNDPNFKELSFSEDDYGDLTHSEYSELITSFNKEMNRFSDHHIARLALLPFFVNAIFLCKSNPFVFFGKPVIELTMYQSELFSKGLFYKSILEQGHQPPSDFYEDLDKLVNWYELKSKSKAGPQDPTGGIHNNNSNVKRVSDAQAQGMSYVGATKEEMKELGQSAGFGTTDLTSEAKKLKEALGKEELDIYDMAKLHGI